MSGLLLKDMYVLVKQLKIFLFLTPIFILSGEVTAIFFILMLFSSLPMTAMGYDEQSKWNNYAVMMPYSTSQLVVSKYILGYIFVITAIVISILFNLLSGGINLGTFTPVLNLNSLMLCSGGTLIYISLNMVVSFKFGVERGRIIYILGFAALGALTSLADSETARQLLEISPVMILGLAVVMNVVSIFLSIKFRNKD